MTATAFLEQHTYPDGYGRKDLDKPFWIARCDHPSHGPIALNSGHHYVEDVKCHAEALIAQHDAEEHPSDSTYCWLCSTYVRHDGPTYREGVVAMERHLTKEHRYEGFSVTVFGLGLD